MSSNDVAVTLSKVLSESRKILILLDFDGTLSEIVQNPDDAALYPPAEKILESLNKCRELICGIMTGRTLEDVKKKVPIQLPIWSGNHGFQVEIFGERFSLSGNESGEQLKEIAGVVMQKFPGEKGLLIEHKGFTLSIHTRRLDHDMERAVMEFVRRLVSSYPSFTARVGKKVIEVLPAEYPGKGGAFEFILEKLERMGLGECFPVYFGDDVTDIEVYERMVGRGEGVFVFVRGSDPVNFEGELEVDGVDGVVKCLRKLYEITISRREK